MTHSTEKGSNMDGKKSDANKNSANSPIDETLDAKLAEFITGQLDPASAAALEKEIAEDKALEDEANFLRGLQQGLKESEDVSPPGALGLAKLKRDIQSEQLRENRSKQAKMESNTQQDAAHEKASPKRAANDGGFWRPLSIAACCLLAVQSFFMLPSTSETDPEGITTLSGTPLFAGKKLQVVFANTAKAQQIQSALLKINGRIVDGPGALGVYTVLVPEGTNIESVTQTLTGYGFVEEVQPISTE